LNIYNFFFYYILKLVNIRFIDWASIFMLGKRPVTTVELIYTTITQITWDGTLGIIFAFLLTKINSQRYLLKGVIYGFFIGFSFRSLAVMFKLPFLSQPVATRTNLINVIGIIIWGLILSTALHFLDKNTVE